MEYGNKLECDTDSRFKAISSIGEYTFFKVNGAGDLKSRLYGFDLSDSYSYSLFGRNNIAFKLQCRYMLEEIDEISGVFESISSSCTLILVVNIIMVIILLISSLTTRAGNDKA